MLLLHPMIDDFCNPCEQKKHESLREREREKKQKKRDLGFRVFIKQCSSSFRVFIYKNPKPIVHSNIVNTKYMASCQFIVVQKDYSLPRLLSLHFTYTT